MWNLVLFKFSFPCKIILSHFSGKLHSVQDAFIKFQMLEGCCLNVVYLALMVLPWDGDGFKQLYALLLL